VLADQGDGAAEIRVLQFRHGNEELVDQARVSVLCHTRAQSVTDEPGVLQELPCSSDVQHVGVTSYFIR